MSKSVVLKPRARSNALTLYIEKCREDYKQQFPGQKVIYSEFSRKCAETWKELPMAHKTIFLELAADDKARYDLEMKLYLAANGGKRTPAKKKRDPNAPKRPTTSFFFFCNDKRSSVKEQNPDYKVGDVAKELGRMWSGLNAGTKAFYKQIADQDKERYLRDMAVYRAKQGQERSQIQVNIEDDDDDVIEVIEEISLD